MNFKSLIAKCREYFFLVVGTLILAFSTANILLPNQLSTGGFSGIATIFY